MHVLQPFLVQCVPDDVHPLYNGAVDLLVTYQHTTAYNALIELTAEQASPYAPYHRDTVNGILIESLGEIIHDHGIIASGTLAQLVQLGQSFKQLTESPDLESIDNALQAFPDHPHDCMQRVLEAHGGLNEWHFAEVVQLVTPSCIGRLEAHAQRTMELLEQQISANDELPEIDPELAEQKRQWLIKYKDHPDMQIVMNYVRETQCALGHHESHLIDELREQIVPLCPGQPKVAAATLIGLVVLSSISMSSVYSVAPTLVSEFWDDVTFNIAVGSFVSEFSAEDTHE